MEDQEIVGRWQRPWEPAPEAGPEAYDDGYADRYDEDWWESERWGPEADNHLAALRPLLSDTDVRWLDCGCGTGWLLSQFPGVARGGFDLTPAMLDHARAANPDALFLRENDLRHDVEEWHDGFDVVTCTGQPWMYLPSIADVDRAVANMAGWTAPDGVLFVPISDLTDFTGMPLDANPTGQRPPEGLPVISGAFWSQYEYGGMHHHMIAPSLSTWIELFSRYFRTVEIARWPHTPDFLPIARRTVIGRDKRATGDTGPTTVIEHAVPGGERPSRGPGAVDLAELDSLRCEVERLQGENGRLEGDRQATERTVAELRRQLVAGEAALAREAEAAKHPPHVCPPPTSAEPLGTGAMAKELARRMRPSDGRVWKTALRRVRRTAGKTS